MKYNVIETNETIELSIVDCEGADWSRDFIGSHNDIDYDDEIDMYCITQASADFYAELLPAYSDAYEQVERFIELGDVDRGEFDRHSHDYLQCDLEDQPAAMIAAIESFGS